MRVHGLCACHAPSPDRHTLPSTGAMTSPCYVAVNKFGGHEASGMAAGRSFWISVFLLLVLIQMLTSLVLFAGVFILSSEAVISPFHFCLTRQHGELTCDKWYSSVNGTESEIKINILTTAVILGLYVPVVLVAFALLAMLLAAYAKDRAALWLSKAYQAASSLLILTGLVAFLLLSWSYVSWEHMTVWFYICFGVHVQLVILTALTHMSGKRLTSDWE